MQHSTQIAAPKAEQPRLIRLLLPAVLLLILSIVLLAYQPWATGSTPSTQDWLPLGVFEEQSGLKVYLVGVSGGGGLVDFRLKITDRDKARQFLLDPSNLPISLVAENGTQILAADSMDEDIQWNDGAILFIMLPNSGGLIQPGSLTMIRFGNILLEPVPAQ